MKKRLLMVAFHFPPLVGSSGIQRTVRFAQQLPGCGWEAEVLSAHPRAYEQTGTDLLAELPPDLKVMRPFALDASRHLAIGGHYPGGLARPDRWLAWMVGAIPAGLHSIRKRRPLALWSTYPIPTAHLICYSLARLTGIPWVADFRDPMAHDGYPQDPKTWLSYLNVEKKVFATASCAVFATPGAARLYRTRYPDFASRIHVIENGYDEDAFASAESMPRKALPTSGRFTLLHSGIVYPEWRNPKALFVAVRALLDCGEPLARILRLRFRAPVHTDWLAKLAAQHGLTDIVDIAPPLPYQEALREMLDANALLVLQGADCNDQIPAKVYEYLRARRPILGLTDERGDTAALLRQADMGPICALESSEAIQRSLLHWLQSLQNDVNPAPNEVLVRSASRSMRTLSLAALLDKITGQPDGKLA